MLLGVTQAGMYAEQFHSLSWLVLALLMLGFLFVPVLLKAVLHTIGGADFLQNEVWGYTVLAAAVVFVPVYWLPLVILFSLLAGFGAYRRQHSRFIIRTKYTGLGTVTRPADAAVGLSDVFLLLFVGTAAQYSRTHQGTVPYVVLLVTQLPVLLGLALAYRDWARTGSGRPSLLGGDRRDTTKPTPAEVFAYVVLRPLNAIALVLFATAPLVGLLLFGTARSGIIVGLVAAAAVVTVCAVLLPDAAQLVLRFRVKRAVRSCDLMALLKLTRSVKVFEEIHTFLSGLLEQDEARVEELIDLCRRGTTPADIVYSGFAAIPERALARHADALLDFVSDSSVPISKRERVLSGLYGKDCGALLTAEKSSEKVEPFVRELVSRGSAKHVVRSITTLLLGLVSVQTVDKVRTLRVRSDFLLQTMLSSAREGEGSEALRAGIVNAALKERTLQVLDEVGRTLKEAEEDPDVLEALRTVGLVRERGGWVRWV